jgi:hypothetical protein
MAEVSEQDKIVCPLCLMISIATDGEGGAIQSYRCTSRANGWETRPTTTDSKWMLDFQNVLHGEKGKLVSLQGGTPMKLSGTLSNPELIPADGDVKGKPQLPGMGFDEKIKVFKFTQEDGERSYQLAIKLVTTGQLRAPRNWNAKFAETAGIDLDGLKQQFPGVYESGSRGGSAKATEEEPIADVGNGFFFGADAVEETTPTNGDGPLTTEEHPREMPLIHSEPEEEEAEPEEDVSEDQAEAEATEEDEMAAYSVTAESVLEPPNAPTYIDDSFEDENGDRVYLIHRPKKAEIQHISTAINCVVFSDSSGAGGLKLHRVHTDFGDMWVQEGINPNNSEMILKVNA